MVEQSFTIYLLTDHPQCDFIDGLFGLNFPLDEYNTVFKPALIPTQDFSHRFVFKESSEKENDGIHCLWRDDSRKWILGLCKNIDNDIGDYYLDIDFECPNVDKGWKDMRNNKTINGMMKEIKDRITVGRRITKSSVAGIFLGSGSKSRERVRMCLEWDKNIFTRQYECLKFFPPLVKRKRPPFRKTCKL